jgi:hypothetical protein
MEAAPANIIVAETQAMTARDSFVMRSHPSLTNRRSRHQHDLQSSRVNYAFLDNRNHKYRLLWTSSGHNGNLRVLVCDIYHF